MKTEAVADMFTSTSRAISRVVSGRAPIFEPIAVVALVSVATSIGIQPFVAHALAPQGPVAQGAAQAALWLSGVLSPAFALGKAMVAALVCWSCAVFLEEPLPLVPLLSLFCIAELVYSLRDIATWAALFARGVHSVHSSADLMVPFGIASLFGARSALARVTLGSWDLFTLAWAVVAFFLLRARFGKDIRTCATLAMMAFFVRVLFAAASTLYSL